MGLLTKKFMWMVDEDGPEHHGPDRPPSPAPSVGSAVPHTPEHPPSKSPSVLWSTGRPCHRSLPISSSSSIDSSESPQKQSHTDSESESKSNNETDSKADTNAGSNSSGEKSEGSASGGSQHGDSDSKSNSDAEDSGSESEGLGSSSGCCAYSNSTESEDEEKKPSSGKAHSEADTDTSQYSLLPEVKSTDTEEEWRTNCHAFVHLKDVGFGTWQDQKIKEGHEQWSKQDMMTCDHVDPAKKAKSPDPLGAPIDYMESCDVFKPM